MPLAPYQVRWVRWLASCGLPSDHIVDVLGGVDPADVAELLRRPPGAHTITHEQEAAVRERAAAGETLAAIAAATGMSRQTAWGVLHCPRATGPPDGPPPRRFGERILGQTANKIRRLSALGYDPGRIAELLHLGRAEVRDFLRRLEPARRPRNGTGELTRPRSHVEHRRMRRRRPKPPPAPRPADSWGYRDVAGDDDLVDAPGLEVSSPPAIAAAEVLPELPERIADQAPPAMPPRASIDPAEWTTGRAWGAADPGARRRPELEARARELRAAGMTRGAIAAALGVSIATVGRLTRGQAHGQGMRSLSVEQAAEVRALHAAGATQGELAARFGVHPDTIARALRRAPGPAAGDAGPLIVGTPDPSPATSPAEGWDYRDNSPRDDMGLEAWPMLEVALPTAEALEPIAPPPSAAEGPWGYLNGAVARVDHAAGVRALELRAQGWTWRAIGRELGVKGETAQRAAWRAAERTES